MGIGGIHGETAQGWFIVKKDIKNNILYVASGPESDRLNSDSCLVTDLNFITDKPKDGQHINVKFRYRQKDNGVTIFYKGDDLVELKFDEPYKAVTPGQAAVFYDGDICLGGGLIANLVMVGFPSLPCVLILSRKYEPMALFLSFDSLCNS